MSVRLTTLQELMKEINIGKARTDEGSEIAKLHKEYIHSGFLSSLGSGVLELLYRSIIDSDKAFCIVARDNEKIVGFVSGAEKMGGIYMKFVRDNFVTACMLLIPKCLKPVFIRKIFESLFYPMRMDKNLPPAELMSIVVEGDYQGMGVSKDLFQSLVEEFRKRRIGKFKVIVGDDLLAAKKFYENMDCVLENKPIEVHKGEISRVYTYEC